ncbi:MAG: hypothetical protein H7222_08300 [Methylotenera sp.]|nr:hypothetical protein [Oligoflexia bacterium]
MKLAARVIGNPEVSAPAHAGEPKELKNTQARPEPASRGTRRQLRV